MAKEMTKKIRFGVETDNDLVLSTVRLPFSNKLGALLNIFNAENALDISSYFETVSTLPGVLVHDIVPTVGRNNESLNTYIAKLYARLIRKISGAKDIEKTDQFMYIQIGKSCVDMVCKLKTIYELAFIYKEYNLYWPKGMLYALGVDADNIAENLEDFRAWINRFISRLRSFNFPNIAYLKSGWDIARTILVDTPDLPRSQAYVFNIRYVYSWDPISDSHGTKLVLQDIFGSSDNKTFSDIRTKFDSIVDSFAYDQDFIDISAWYDHLYENNPDGLLKWTDCTESMEHVQISNDSEALTVAENIEILPYYGDRHACFDIYQLSNEIEQNLAFDISATGTTNEQRNIAFVTPHIVNTHTSKVTDKQIAKYCTFKYSYSIYSAGKDGGWPVSAVMFVDTTNDYCVENSKFISYINGSLSDANGYKEVVSHNSVETNLLPIITQFYHRPINLNAAYKIESGHYDFESNGKYLRYQLQSKLDNYIEVANSILYNYHLAVWFCNLEDK